MNEEDRFRKALAESMRAAMVVANYYKGRGYEVSVPEIVVRPHFDQRSKYGDGGDVFIQRSGNRYRVEVKHRSLHFTCASDFLFDTVNIDRVSKTALADMYVSVNTSMTHAAFASTRKTRGNWIVDVSADNGKGYTPYKIYRCHKMFLTFKEIGLGYDQRC